MFDVIGFDPKTLSNDELLTKQLELAQRKIVAARTGSAAMVTQIDVMLRAIDTERRERMFVDRTRTLPKSPVVIETDPALRHQDEVEEVNTPDTPTQPLRPTRRPIRSSTPIKPTGE